MRCDTFESQLNQVIDERANPAEDAELRAHAEECVSCRELLMTWESVAIALDASDRPTPSAGFANRVLDAVPVTVAASRSTATRGTLKTSDVISLVVGLAVVFCLACLPFLSGTSDRATRQNRMAAKNPLPVITADQPLAIAVDQPKTVVAQTPEEFPDLLGNLSPWLEEVPTKPVSDLTHQFRPVTTSFSVAIEAIRKTIPGRRESEKQDDQPQARYLQFERLLG